MHFLLLIENVVNLPTKLMYENFSYIAIKKKSWFIYGVSLWIKILRDDTD